MIRLSTISEAVCSRRASLFAAALLLGLSGCTGLRLHDASKAATADSVKQQFTDAKVTETVDAAIANSKVFLNSAEEIAGREAKVRKERAQLAIAESDDSMAEWLQERWTEQAALGFANTANLHARLQANTSVEAARKTAGKNRDRLRSFARDPAVAALLSAPTCKGIDAQTEPPETSKLSSFEASLYQDDYGAYRRSCTALAEAQAAVPKDIVSDSALERAQKARAAAIAGREDLAAELNTAKQELERERKSLKAAVKVAEQGGKSDLAELRKKAGQVGKAASKVAELAEKQGVETVPLESIKSLAVILSAASSGSLDKEAVAGDERLEKASLAAAELPSLAEDAINLLRSGRVPPTNHLILELNHQQILYSRAQTLSNLWNAELSLHDRKIAALEEQAKQYREIQYRLCNYATRKAVQKHQGANCATMSFENKGKVCIIGPPGSSLTIADCVLANSWRDNYKGLNKPREKRQLLAALLAQSRALDAQAEVRKTDFQMIDIGHQRVAASNRAAIAAWNNLVQVPVDTLAAYYAAGIKPDTIASAAAQLIGLLGIGVGIGVSD